MHRRDVVRLAFALVLLATPAHATILKILSFEDGYPQANPTPADFNYWAAQPTPTSGATPKFPLVSSTNPPTLPAGTKRWSMRFQPTSGETQYRCVTVPAQTTISVTMALRFNDLGAIGTTARLAWFDDGTTTGALLQATSGGTGTPTLGVYLGDTSTQRCTGSTSNDKVCTTTADCTSVNPVETGCSVPIAASVLSALNSWRLVTLTHVAGTGASAGTLTGGLYEGALYNASTGTTAAYSRGSQAVRVGQCSDGAACNVAGDCSSGGCTTTANVSPTRVCFGKPDTGTFAGDWQMAWAVIQNDSTPYANQYVLGLDPAAIPTPNTNWGNVGSAHSCGANNLPACLNDGANGGADSGSSGVGHPNPFGNKPTVAINFADAATPAVAATPRAIVLEAVGQDDASGGSNSGIVQLRPEYSGTVTPNPTPAPFDMESFAGTGGASDPYYRMPSSLWERAWTGAEINSLTGVLNKVGGGSGDTPRITSLEASVLYQTADPVVPTIIPDHDQDSQDTVCWVGDSRTASSNTVYRAALSSGLLEPTNMYFYSRGGAKWGDWEAEFTSMIEGATGTFLSGGSGVSRGTSGKTCDVILTDMLTNTMNPGSIADPRFDTFWSGIGQGGFCFDDGGANSGNDCTCPNGIGDWTSNYHSTPAPNTTPGARYVIAHGQFGQDCGDSNAGNSIVARCSSNSDCVINGVATPGGTCQTATPPTPAVTPGGICVGSFGCRVNQQANQRQGFCVPGCKDSPECPGGVCARLHTLTDVDNGLHRIVAALAARPTPAATPPLGGKPIIVYEFPPEGQGLGCWSSTRPTAGAYRHLLRTYAKANNLPFIDLWAIFHRAGDMYASACADPCTNDRALFRDYVHYNAKGQTLKAAAEIACLTNAVEGEAAGTSTHDGICTGNVCTRGLIGDACSTAADCDTWSCDFGAQP